MARHDIHRIAFRADSERRCNAVLSNVPLESLERLAVKRDGGTLVIAGFDGQHGNRKVKQIPGFDSGLVFKAHDVITPLA